MKKLAGMFSLVAALVVSAPVVAAQARHSADDPSTEVRHGADDRAGDDRGGRAKTLQEATAKAKQQRHGADDPAGDDRGGHGRGGDDGSNHT